eukprot:6491485-Amphidinium_carterae.1
MQQSKCLVQGIWHKKSMHDRRLWKFQKGPTVGAQGKCPKNLARDLNRRWLAPAAQWPELYMAKLPTDEGEWDIGFHLPHHFVQKEVFGQATVQADMQKYRRSTLASLSVAEDHHEEYLPLSLWGDSVPFTKEMSLFMVFCSVANGGSSHRYLVTCFPTLGANQATYSAMWHIISWSFRCLWLGAHPVCRHDGEEWLTTDRDSRTWTGQALAKSFLGQLRGDWEFFFKVQLHEMCDFTKCEPISADTFFLHTKTNPCELFTLPTCSTTTVAVDWLHTVDLGVSQDLQGNILFNLLKNKESSILEGSTQAARLQSLNQYLKDFYKRAKPSNRYKRLTEKLIKAIKAPPKLKGKAAEARALLPMVVELAKQ